MKRIWKFLGFVLALALLLTIGVSGTLAQLPVVPGVKPPDSKYVSGEILVKFYGAPPGRGHGALRGARAVDYAASLPAKARFALGEIRGKAVRAFPSLGVLQVNCPWTCRCQKPSRGLNGAAQREHAEPNFLFFACPKPPAPDPDPIDQKLSLDEYFGIQWALNNTGQTIYLGLVSARLWHQGPRISTRPRLGLYPPMARKPSWLSSTLEWTITTRTFCQGLVGQQG